MPYPTKKKYKVYEEKSIEVVVARPPWASAWAIAGYALLAISAVTIAVRIVMLRRQKKAIGGKDTLLHKYRP